jgi:L-lactate utilization protein LutB
MIKTAQNIKSYKRQLKEALKDKFLRTALGNFNTAYRENRPKVYEGIDFETIKQEIAQAKDTALPRLLELFDEFKTHAEGAGVKVHVAKDALEANQIIARIADDNAVKHIVKSKSMTAEETFLNTHLENKGFKVTETDLGEWIIQLRHEGPSHMVMPAIHLSRYQVGDLFEEVSQEKLDPENIEKSRAEILVTDCPGCVMQLRGGMDKRGGKIEVKHIAEAVAEQLIKKKAVI